MTSLHQGFGWGRNQGGPVPDSLWKETTFQDLYASLRAEGDILAYLYPLPLYSNISLLSFILFLRDSYFICLKSQFQKHNFQSQTLRHDFGPFPVLPARRPCRGTDKLCICVFYLVRSFTGMDLITGMDIYMCP